MIGEAQLPLPARGGELTHLAAAARKTGWTTGSGTLSMIRAEAGRLGWIEIATRHGDPTVSMLRPLDAQHAHPRSLSAVYGLGAQPLHTDGAHLRRPPDIVVLHTETPNSTPTLLWAPIDRPSHLVDAMFTVHGGSDRFLTTAYTYKDGLRYDPGCMAPCNQRGRIAERYFSDCAHHAVQHRWTMHNQFLVIDNQRALHARAVVAERDTGRVLTRIAFQTGAHR
ncbi:hypothetical protein [Rhodococcus sp. NPDC057529]|uniref:hypothetical protein n=1 Tax=Rhodococcus sp. NPDC057529 TaxID=3346158 RepID=UPI00366E9F4E